MSRPALVHHNLEDRDEIERAAFKMLKAYLEADTASFAGQTAIAIYAAATGDGPDFHDTWGGWIIAGGIIDLAEQVPFDHHWHIKLARLYTAIHGMSGSRIPVVRSEQSSKGKSQQMLEKSETDAWKSSLSWYQSFLPAPFTSKKLQETVVTPRTRFYWDIAGEEDLYSYCHPMLGRPGHPRTNEQWLNYVGFASRMIAFGHRGLEREAICMMKYSFEGDSPKRRSVFDSNIDAPDGTHLETVHNFLYAGAAIYMLNAGETLFTKMVQYPYPERRDELKRPGGGVIIEPGPLLKDICDEPYGLTRWTFWRKGFEAAAEREDGDVRSRDLAGRAAELMAILERTMFK